MILKIEAINLLFLFFEKMILFIYKVESQREREKERVRERDKNFHILVHSMAAMPDSWGMSPMGDKGTSIFACQGLLPRHIHSKQIGN